MTYKIPMQSLIDHIKTASDVDPWAKDMAEKLLKEQDAKPLRCKECSYHRNDGWCNEHGREVKEFDFCSFGAWEGR